MDETIGNKYRFARIKVRCTSTRTRPKSVTNRSDTAKAKGTYLRVPNLLVANGGI
jgi:hypothetical protein